MPYTITVSEDKNYIYTKSTGGLSFDIAREQNMEAQALGLKLGIDRFFIDLVDSCFEGRPVDHYEFANSRTMPENQYNRYARVVILVHPEDSSHDFFETVARNAGFDISIFRDREAALNHLLHDL